MGENSIRYKLVARGFHEKQDYDMMASWWKSHGSLPPKPEFLSTTGIVIEADHKPVCLGFMYRTDSKICVFEFVTCDPEAEKQVRDDALDYLIKAAKFWADTQGFTLTYTSVKTQKYISRLKKQDFIEVDNNMTHLFYFKE